MKSIHLNCDLGEGGRQDAAFMPLISACNIACGGHAGTLESMHRTVNLALENSVQIGAHPSYPDKENFGRKSMSLPSKELKRSLLAQILSLKQITEAEGGKLSHIKLHGALYNDAARDEQIAEIVLEVLLEFHEPFQLYAPADSTIAKLCEAKISVVREAFADRTYGDAYELIPRSHPNALITEKEQVLKHLLSMFLDGKIRTETGAILPFEAETFCLHSDTPFALEILEYLNVEFRKRNMEIWRE